MSRTRNALKKISIERLRIELTDESIDSGKSFKDIGVDSLDAIELVVSVEDELDIEYEVIVVDDGSTDMTEGFINELMNGQI